MTKIYVPVDIESHRDVRGMIPSCTLLEFSSDNPEQEYNFRVSGDVFAIFHRISVDWENEYVYWDYRRVDLASTLEFHEYTPFRKLESWKPGKCLEWFCCE